MIDVCGGSDHLGDYIYHGGIFLKTYPGSPLPFFFLYYKLIFFTNFIRVCMGPTET